MRRLACRLQAVQLLRYGLAGLGSNALLYGLYLLLARAGMPIELAMTMAYCAGIALSYFLHRRWTFDHDKPWRQTLPRYVAALALGYLVNLAGLVYLVDVAKLPHPLSQALMIFVVALLLYLLQKHWVFAKVALVGLPSSGGGR